MIMIYAKSFEVLQLLFGVFLIRLRAHDFITHAVLYHPYFHIKNTIASIIVVFYSLSK